MKDPLSAFRSWRVGVMVPFGFSSGLPNPMVGSTLTAWLATEGVDKTTIGLFALVSLPYNLKFLWAPLMDRFQLPFLTRRRGWIFFTQWLLFAAVGALGFTSPTDAPNAVAVAALIVAFISASQDIVSDAYRTDILPAHERASGTAVFVAGYRFAMIIAGAGALILSDHVSWTTVYLLLGGMIALSSIATLLAPTPAQQAKPPANWQEAVVVPVKEFFSRRGSVRWTLSMLTIVALYKVGDAIAGHMLIPFMLDVGFSRTEVGAILKGLGLATTIGGALLGGVLVARWGLRRTLISFGILQAVANILYASLAVVGKDYALMTVAIGVDNLCGGLGTAAFVAFLMTLCNQRFTAFQYALLSSLSSVAGRFLGAGGGWMVEQWDWPLFFIITILAAVPAIVLLFIADIPEEQPALDATPSPDES
jgi:PAT family beta-lactamase induction signal transducer AmpG